MQPDWKVQVRKGSKREKFKFCRRNPSAEKKNTKNPDWNKPKELD